MLTVAQLQVELTANTKPGEDALMRISIKVQQTGKELEKTGGLFTSLPSHIGGAISGLLNFGSQIGMTIFGLQGLVGGIVSLGSSLLSGNADMEQTTVAFTNMLGSADAANKAIKDMKQFAASTPFEFKDIADSTQMLLGFGYQLKETRPLLTAIGDDLSAVGKLSSANLQGVVMIFGQIHASGHVMTQDLQQLTSYGINGFQLLAKALVPTKDQLKALAHDGFGKVTDKTALTTAMIQDLVTKGLIPSDQAIQALTKGIENNPIYAGGMAKQSQTFLGVLSTVKDVAGQFVQTLMSPVFGLVEDALGKIADVLQSKGFADFASGVGKGMADTFDHIGQFLGTLKDNFLKAFNDPNGEKVRKLKELAHDLLEKLGELKDFLKEHLEGALKDVATAAGNITDWISNSKQHFDDVKSWWKDWGGYIEGAATAITVFFLPAMIKAGITAGVQSTVVATTWIATTVKAGLTAIVSAGQMWTNAFSFVGAMVATAASAVKNAAIVVANWITAMISSGNEAMIASGKTWTNAGGYVAALVATAASAVKNAAIVVASWVAAMISSGYEAVVAAGKIVASFIASMVSAAASAIKQGAIIVSNFVASMITAGNTAETQAVNVNAFATAEQGAGTKATGAIGSGVKGAAAGIGILGLAAAIWWLYDKTTEAGDAFANWSKPYVYNAINQVKNWVGDLLVQVGLLKKEAEGFANTWNNLSPPPGVRPGGGGGKPKGYASGGTSAGGWLTMNEDGRGELAFLPGGSLIVPHDLSKQIANAISGGFTGMSGGHGGDTIILNGPTTDQLMMKLAAAQQRQKALTFGGRR